MKYIPNFLRASVVLLLLTALAPLKADEIEVFAAASLTDALKEIAATYEKDTGDKSSSISPPPALLDMQIKAGAPADIFFSADEAKMDDLAKSRASSRGTRKDLLSNSLVIVVPDDSSVK